MEIISVIDQDIAGGVRVRTTLDGEEVTLFIVVAEPDLELLAEIVPHTMFENGTEIHATIIQGTDDVEDKLLEVLDNMNPGDAAVFLCETPAVLESSLDALDISDAPDSLN